MDRRIRIAALFIFFALVTVACRPMPTPTPTTEQLIATGVAQTVVAMRTPSLPGPVSPTPFNIPVVQVLSPVTNQSVFANQQINVTGTAGDDIGIKTVLLYDNNSAYSSQQPPVGVITQNFSFSIPWQSGALGPHTLTVVAQDTDNNYSTPQNVSISVVVSTTPPSVQILSPTTFFGSYTANWGSPVTVQAQGTDQTAVIRLALFVDGRLYQSAQTPNPGGQSSFATNFSWVATGVGGLTHTLFVRATNVSGNIGDSAPLVVTVADNIPPTIANAFNPPGDSLNPVSVQVNQRVTITSVASDLAGVDHIEFWADGQKLDQRAGPNATFVWSSSVKGTHDLFTRAYDVAGNMADSAHQTVLVGANRY